MRESRLFFFVTLLFLSVESGTGYPLLDGKAFTVKELSEIKKNLDTTALEKKLKNIFSEFSKTLFHGKEVDPDTLTPLLSKKQKSLIANLRMQIDRNKILDAYLFW